MASNDHKSIEYTQTDKDDVTGAITWDVEYKSNLKTVYENFSKLKKNLLELSKQDPYKKDPAFVNLTKEISRAYSQFKKHLKQGYPKEYNSLQLKERIRKGVKEMSTFGAVGAYSTPKAFVDTIYKKKSSKTV